MENIRLAMECTPSYMPDVSVYEVAIGKLQEENAILQETISAKEIQLNQLRTQMASVREDRDRMKRRTRELQTRVQSLEASAGHSPHDSRTSTPTKHPTLVNPTTGERYTCSCHHFHLDIEVLWCYILSYHILLSVASTGAFAT